MSQKVSVIATVRDEADSIEPFLSALLNQTRPPDEIIISDGGSTDGTPEVVRRIAARNPTLQLVHAPGTNIASGRNVAIRRCAGPIVAVGDAGAVPRADWLEKLVAPLEDPDVDVSGGFFVPGGSNFIERCISVVITPQLPEIDHETFLPSSRSLAFRTEWWERVGGYPEWLDHSEDIVFDLALKRAGAVFRFASDAIVTWRPRSNLRGFAKQYFYYARGDAYGRLWPERHAVRYGVYLVLAALLLRVPRKPSRIGFIVAGARPYLRRHYQRVDRVPPARTPLQSLTARALVPLIVVIGDIAKMLGYAAGQVERRRAQPPAALPSSPQALASVPQRDGAIPKLGDCPACGGTLRPWRVATASDPQLAGRRSYELARCEDCGSARTLVRPGTGRMGPLYEAGTYGPPHPAVDRMIEPLRILAERDKMRFLRGMPAGARVMEVGAGDGSFVARLRAAGLDARGIEPSSRGVALARARGAPVERAGLNEISMEPGSVDALIAWHVLEHLPEPADALERVRGWLRPGGRIVVACPNRTSLQAAIGGDRWFHQDVPRHRTHFTAYGLRTLMERSGFRVERVSHLLMEQNPLGMWQTLLNRLTGERDVAYRALKRDLGTGPGVRRDIALTAIAGPLLVPVAIGLELGAGFAGRGGTVVVVGTLEDTPADSR